MIISLNWIHDFLKTNLSSEKLADGLTDLGLECTYETTPLSFDGVVLGKVLECDPHPQSDHLSLCQVDVGDGKVYPIVCGAPNVRKGINVPVAKIGGTLNNGEFKIKKAKLRGIKSEGMICSGKELMLNDDHEGIMIIDTDQKPGVPIEQVLDFGLDVIFDIDLTPNRGDCFSHIGVAREIALLEQKDINKRQTIINESETSVNDLASVQIDDPDGCPRYAARIVKDVKIGPSPKWLADRMIAIGQNSINNVVDAANFVLMDTGHPLHTFDLKEIKSKNVIIRFAKNGEKITLLDEIEYELKDFQLLICDGENPVALAGVMGGLGSGVSDSTTDILIESAYFTPAVVRKGAKTFDLSTEASKRFERDTDINNVILALNQLANLIVEVAGGTITKGIIDVYPKKKKQNTITFSPEKCNHLLGTNIPTSDIENIFAKLEIQSVKKDDDLECKIPSFRNDLERHIDLVEEVARVHGFNNLPTSNNFSGNYLTFIDDEHLLHNKLLHHLPAFGFHEHYSNSLIPEYQSRHFSVQEPVPIANPISQEMGFLRTSLLPGLLSAVSYNEKRKQEIFKLFEIGAVHQKTDNTATYSKEDFLLALVWYGSKHVHWRNLAECDIFRVKGELQSIISLLGCNNLSFVTENIQGYEHANSIYFKKMKLGHFGILTKQIHQDYDIDGNLIVFEGNLSEMDKIIIKTVKSYQPPIAYPSSYRDISILVPKQTPVEELMNTIRVNCGNKLKEVQLFDFYESDELGANQKSLAFSLRFQSEKGNLKAKTVDKMISKIIAILTNKHQAVQR